MARRRQIPQQQQQQQRRLQRHRLPTAFAPAQRPGPQPNRRHRSQPEGAAVQKHWTAALRRFTLILSWTMRSKRRSWQMKRWQRPPPEGTN